MDDETTIGARYPVEGCYGVLYLEIHPVTLCYIDALLDVICCICSASESCIA